MDVHRLENGITVDVCPLTGGVWLDLGELSAFTGLESDLPYFEAAVSNSRDTIWPSPAAGCCLREIRFHPDYDVVLDYCPVSGGVWLDPGELDKVRAIVAALPRPSNEYSEAVTALRTIPPEVQAAIDAGAAEGRRLGPGGPGTSPSIASPGAAAEAPALGPDGRRLPPRPRAKR